MQADSSARVISPIGETRAGSTLILFLPGLTGNGRQWRFVVAGVRDLPVNLAYGAPIAPHPVFGGAWPTVSGLARALAGEIRGADVQEALIVSHSVGAFVALDVARLLPDRVRTVVLVNGGLTKVAKFLDEPWQELRASPRTCLNALRLFMLASTPAPAVMQAAIASSEVASRLVFGNLVSRAAVESGERRRILVRLAGGPAVLRTLWHNRHYWREFRSFSKEIEADVLFLVGELDPVGGEQDANEMAALLPNTRIEVLRGVGHAGPIERPDAVVAAVRQAIKTPHIPRKPGTEYSFS